MDPKMAQNGESGAQANLDRGFKKALGPKMPPRAEGKAETGSVYRGCTFCPALCCFELLWAALDYSGLLWVALCCSGG